MKSNLLTALTIISVTFSMTFPHLVLADDISTSVTVGNDPPAFTTDATCTGSFPCESPARDATSPVNVGTSTTFRATADEPNGEDYYLIVCKTDSFTENNGAAPECASAADTICVSTATTDATAATCNYTALTDDDENQAWYAKVCDNNATDQNCSASTQGNTGGAADEASPLVVNHPPLIIDVSNDADTGGTAQDPGLDVTWTVNASDPDTSSGDTLDLHVCSTASHNGTSCDATTLCTQTGQASDPSCSYTIPAGTDDDASPYDAYAFIIDNHDFDSSVSSSSAYYVANVAPTVLSISTNSGSDITLTGGESTTTDIDFVVTVQDNNGCNDLSGTITDHVLYRSSVTNGNACTGNVNECYTGTTGDYAVSCATNSSCTGGTDVDTVYTCTASMQYHSDPTVANTPNAADTWLAYFEIDDDDASTASDTATGVELNMLQALDSGNLSYGTMTAGTNDATLEDSNSLTNTGNTALDAEVSSAADMSDGGTNTIAVNNQRADETQSTAWASAAVTLSGTGQEIEVDMTKTTVTGSPETDAIYWGINIPLGTFPATYTGTTTVAAVYSEVGQGW